MSEIKVVLDSLQRVENESTSKEILRYSYLFGPDDRGVSHWCGCDLCNSLYH